MKSITTAALLGLALAIGHVAASAQAWPGKAIRIIVPYTLKQTVIVENLLPDVPTIAEQGVPGFESGTWQGLLVPAGTPNDVVARLSAELTRIIRSPEIRSRLTAQGAEVYTMSPAEYESFFDKEQKRWAVVVASGGAKID